MGEAPDARRNDESLHRDFNTVWGHHIVTDSTGQWTSLLNEHWGPTARALRRIQTGLSDSVVCEVEFAEKRYCLKGTPDTYSSTRLRWIHGLRRHACELGLDWIPDPVRTKRGDTCAQGAGMIWELSPWMSGDPLTDVSQSQCRNAMRALAQLHTAWRAPQRGPAEVVRERLEFARQCVSLTREVAWERLAAENSHYSWAQDVREVVAQSSLRMEMVIRQLVEWCDRKVPLQPVLRDIWADHMLFEGDDVRGILDFHAVRVGTVASDIGRLLASWRLPDGGQWAKALEWYGEIRPLESDEAAFVYMLDDAARVLTPWVWLRWILLEKRQFASMEKMNNRVAWSFQRLLRDK